MCFDYRSRWMEVFNLATGDLERERDDGDGWRMRAAPAGAAIGGSWIGGTVYELGEGQRNYPYHYHHGVEEWLLVVSGSPTVRLPDGEHVLGPGDVVCFPSGREGAHDVRGPGRVLILSANRVPSISVYPDSGKIGVRPEDQSDRLNFRRGDAVDYWDGER